LIKTYLKTLEPEIAKVNLMRHLITILFVGYVSSLHGQLVTNSNKTPQELVEDILLGENISAFNITYTGARFAIGYFDGNKSNIGIEEGIILTTGTVLNRINNGIQEGPIGPNNTPDGGFNNREPGDSDLNSLIDTFETYNATVLEFDFIPESNYISFEYIFGSEEYIKYVDEDFNDVFAFFISGPGIDGIENIAIIPNSNIPVSIDNVNHIRNTQYYINNGLGDNPLDPSYSDPESIQYNGFTTSMTAESKVVCGEVYHIKIAIADVRDEILDSGVFLRAKSFKSVNPVGIEATLTQKSFNNDYQMSEGCTHANIKIKRYDSINFEQTFPIIISGTASKEDFSGIPSSVTFKAGQETADFFLETNNLGGIEKIESITLEIKGASICNDSLVERISLEIREPDPLTLVVKDQYINCPKQKVSIDAKVNGGSKNYSYRWNTGETTQSIKPDVLKNTSYSVKVTDYCGLTETKRVTVEVNVEIIELNSSNDTTICKGDQIEIQTTARKGNGEIIYNWTHSNESNSKISIKPNKTTTYIVEVEDGCQTYTVSDSVRIIISEPKAKMEILSNYQVEDNEIRFQNNSLRAENYYWDFGNKTFSKEIHPVTYYKEDGKYTVTLIAEDQYYCTDTSKLLIKVEPIMHFYVPNTFTPNGDNVNDYFFGNGVGIENYRMDIYNRWGEIVFTSLDQNIMWNCMKKGELCPQGTYTYHFSIVSYTEKTYRKVGQFTLTR